jgi:hypothetical protein
MVYQQQVVGAITAPGAEKNYKYLYIKQLMDRITKVSDQLPNEQSATKIVAYRDEVIGYVDDDLEKNRMIKDAEDLAIKLENQLKVDNGGALDSKQQIEAKRIAAIRAIGWVLKYFDTTWGWSRKRGILMAGPFGDGRRRFLPITQLPPDGKYIRVSDDYVPKQDEILYDFRLNAILVHYKDDHTVYDDAMNDKEESEEKQAGEEVVNNVSGSSIDQP